MTLPAQGGNFLIPFISPRAVSCNLKERRGRYAPRSTPYGLYAVPVDFPSTLAGICSTDRCPRIDSRALAFLPTDPISSTMGGRRVSMLESNLNVGEEPAVEVAAISQRLSDILN